MEGVKPTHSFLLEWAWTQQLPSSEGDQVRSSCHRDSGFLSPPTGTQGTPHTDKFFPGLHSLLSASHVLLYVHRCRNSICGVYVFSRGHAARVLEEQAFHLMCVPFYHQSTHVSSYLLLPSRTQQHSHTKIYLSTVSLILLEFLFSDSPLLFLLFMITHKTASKVCPSSPLAFPDLCWVGPVFIGTRTSGYLFWEAIVIFCFL